MVITKISTDSGKLRAHVYLGGQLYVGHKVPWVFLRVLEFIHVLFPQLDIQYIFPAGKKLGLLCTSFICSKCEKI